MKMSKVAALTAQLLYAFMYKMSGKHLIGFCSCGYCGRVIFVVLVTVCNFFDDY